jgi:hypothetical protein
MPMLIASYLIISFLVASTASLTPILFLKEPRHTNSINSIKKLCFTISILFIFSISGLFLLSSKFGYHQNLLSYVLVLYFLISIGFIDQKLNIIPNKIVIPLILFLLLQHLFKLNIDFLNILWESGNITNDIINAILTSLGVFLFLYAINLAIPKSIGYGDIKYSILISIFLGFPLAIIALIIGVISCTIYAHIHVAFAQEKILKLPLGPYLSFGTFLSILIGNELLNYYLILQEKVTILTNTIT